MTVPPGSPADPPAVEFSDVTKVYGRRVPVTAIAGLSLTIASGDMVAVTGASGSGKSTLLNLIGGLDAPTSGDIRIFGEALAAMDEDTSARFRRRLVGYVFQAYHLLPTLSAADNVALPLHLQRAPRAEIAARVRAALDQVGLADRVNHLPDELSGGECQRVAIARAIVTEPRLLLADEPTGNLDSVTGHAVLSQLVGLNRDRGTTLVIVTHDMAVAERCRRIVRLHDGRLMETAP